MVNTQSPVSVPLEQAGQEGGREDLEKLFFFNVDHFLKAFIELVIISLLFYILVFLTTRHVES